MFLIYLGARVAQTTKTFVSVGVLRYINLGIAFIFQVFGMTKWTDTDTIIALYGYYTIPYPQFVASNPKIEALSKLMDHSAESLVMKLLNFRSIDPKAKQKGLSHVSQRDIDIWNKYSSNHALLYQEFEKVSSRLNELSPDPRGMTEGINHDFGGPTEKPALVNARLNQNVFRKIILGLYDNECCVTGLKTPCLLEAAHILGWSEYEEGRLSPTNGICINRLFHAAYDNHIVSISPDYKFHVNADMLQCDSREPHILQIFKYYDNKNIYLPDDRQFKPDKDFLELHYKEFKSL